MTAPAADTGAGTGTGAIWLVGAGNMGGAMLRRWVAAGVAPDRIVVVDPGDPPVPGGVRVVPPGAMAGRGLGSDGVLVLAVKPQQLGEVAGGPVGAAAPRLLLSVLAGVEERTLAALWPAGAVVRAMPNLPVAVGQGVTALYTTGDDPQARRLAGALAAPLGHVEWIADEALFDAVTALSGCGPGFVFRFVDALAAAGAALGLPAEQAMRLARATVAGSGAMAMAADEGPAVLADRVASPGGSTRAGLDVLDRGGALRALLAETLAAAAARNGELAAIARAG